VIESTVVDDALAKPVSGDRSSNSTPFYNPLKLKADSSK
jgi:hypothetical protein